MGSYHTRKSPFSDEFEDMDEEDLIARENVGVFMTKNGFVKRISIDSFRSQLRGGRGIAGMGTREDDVLDNVFVVSTKRNTKNFCFMSRKCV